MMRHPLPLGGPDDEAGSPAANYILSLDAVGLGDVARVGGKTASLGELRRLLREGPVSTPDGFAVTAAAYRDALSRAGAWSELAELMKGLEPDDVEGVAARGARARELVYAATGRDALRDGVFRAYAALGAAERRPPRVAVRSSATAEDLPQASFAGQHDSFLHVAGAEAVFEACRRCLASLFTDRAIVYRARNGFNHLEVALSVAVMRMIDADRGASGVVFTLDTESGFPDVVFLTGVYGLGEGLVQGRVEPDEFYVHKPTLRAGFRAVLRRSLGSKATRLVRAGDGGALKARKVSMRDRTRFCLTDEQALGLAEAAMKVEDHYSRRARRWTPMDLEWALDDEGALHILQARPETVVSRRETGIVEVRRLSGPKLEPLVKGRAVGEGAAAGSVRRVATPDDLTRFLPGEVLVARATSPDWLPAMRKAAAIVTDLGGRTCHAAIVARELGVPAVVGCGDATSRLEDGRLVTVNCPGGEEGSVLEGRAPIAVERLVLADLPPTRTAIMLNMARPEAAFHAARLPAAGVGLARMEFIVGERIRVHPMAAAHPDRATSAAAREIRRRAGPDQTPQSWFVRSLSEGIGTLAAAFFPRPVIVRLSDFKSNEYAALLGGGGFETPEENPMLGFRGAARYDHPRYADGFALECQALRRARDQMGLKNIRLMVPFCRRVDEAERVLGALRIQGLERGRDGLEIYLMCEIPNNVVQVDAFARLFDGFSIGSNDLTQLVLGVDRDSPELAAVFDERDPGVLAMMRQAIAGAHRHRRPIGICGEAPATFPEIAQALVRAGVDSISVTPSSFFQMVRTVALAEASDPPRLNSGRRRGAAVE